MKLLHLRLLNWGPFYGDHTVDFGFETKKQISVILGKNNFGKTKILEALKWLYAGGSEYVDPGLYVNRKAALEGKDFQVTVETKFSDKTGVFFLRRKFSVSPGNLALDEIGQVRASLTTKGVFSETVELQQEGKVPFPESATKQVLRRLFPASLVNFNFFDAANPATHINWLETRAEMNNTAKLRKESIETALGFSGPDRLLRMLSQAQESLKKSVADGSVNSKKRNDLIEANRINESKLTHANESLSTATADREVLLDELNQLNDELKGAKDKIDLERRLLENRGALEARRADLIVVREALKKLASDLWFYNLAPDIENELGLVLQNRQSKQDYFQQRNQLEVLIGQYKSQLEVKNCNTCGHELSKDKNAEIALALSESEKKLDELEQPKLSFNDGYIKLIEAIFSSDAKFKIAAFEGRLQELKVLENKIAVLQLEEQNLKNDLGGEGSVGFLLKYQRLSELEGRFIPDYNKAISDFKGQINLLEIESSKLAKQIGKLPGADPTLAGKLVALQKLQRTLAFITEEVRNQVRQKIQDSANAILAELLTPEDGNHSLEVGVDYSIKTTKGAFQTLNDAFKECVALSVMFAIPRVSKTAFPMFVDTPFGNLDADHIAKFVDFMKTELKQIVILPNDANMGLSEIPHVFSDALANFFVLQRDPDSQADLATVHPSYITSSIEPYESTLKYKERWNYIE